MAERMQTERVDSFSDLLRASKSGRTLPFTPQILGHVYIKLDFKHQYENAVTADDARSFLRSVARASMASSAVAAHYEGSLLEVQGSMLHVGVPLRQVDAELSDVRDLLSDLHAAFGGLFGQERSRVDGWRMAVDVGKTLVVAGRGVHGDESWVSLGRSANRPAKHLYAQLELPEERRDLKSYYVGLRDGHSGKWHHHDLRQMPAKSSRGADAASDIREAALNLSYSGAGFQHAHIAAQAVPLAPAGTPGSPTADKPQTHFGWVLRADLDGFTARVDECMDDDAQLQQLAVMFYGIMDAAAQFVNKHQESLAQLPWAGDNFTAAAVFPSRDEYGKAIPRRLVELALDYEKEMAEAAVAAEFPGWAYGIAGGDLHGNSGGNVYLAGIEVAGRRYLVGAGEGFGRSLKAFGDINPKVREMVVYKPDWEKLVDWYKGGFEQAETRRGELSTLFRIAKSDDLVRARSRDAAAVAVTPVTFPQGKSRSVRTKPYFI